MKTFLVSACIVGSVLVAGCATAGRTKSPLLGGYAAASVTDEQVMAAADFAVRAEAKAMQEKKDALPATVTLVKVLGAQQQVVAGMNYRLRLKVRLNGKDKEADAVVWWQAWRAPDPYELTSWNWR
jgi:hypothetical protein